MFSGMKYTVERILRIANVYPPPKVDVSSSPNGITTIQIDFVLHAQKEIVNDVIIPALKRELPTGLSILLKVRCMHIWSISDVFDTGSLSIVEMWKQQGRCPRCGNNGSWIGPALVCGTHGAYAGI